MHTLGRALGHTSQRAANLHQRRMAAARSLPDAHAHPQDDLASAHILERSSVPCVAVMGVRETDWDNVLQLQRMLPSKVIPCFGVHPWFAHQHSVETLSSQLPEDQQLTEPQSASSSAQRESQGGTSGAALPSTTWVDRLESLLQEHPEAVVGECGLDRAAVIPGTKETTPMDHQLALVRHHMGLAARLQRPISLHCVRATGAMQDLLRTLPADALPQRIMLHSFGGPGEAIRQMLLMKQNGVGDRLWFSFSAAVNLAKGNRDKLIQRIQAVPDDRLLIESDQCTALHMEEGLRTILGVVAEARGWTLEHAGEVAQRNFATFYDGFIPTGSEQAAAT